MKHGTSTGYTHHACRCDACRQAQKLYQRKYRSTQNGRQLTRKANAVSQKRAAKAAEWVKENRPDIWDEIVKGTAS